MACFVISAAEAVVVSAATKAVQKKEHAEHAEHEASGKVSAVPFSEKLKWLRNMLCGGSALLAFEHVWHGEVVPWFPFLTAAGNPEDAAQMLHEMSTVGVTMALLVTAVWGGMLGVCAIVEKKAQRTETESA